jgi:hypothetical protein
MEDTRMKHRNALILTVAVLAAMMFCVRSSISQTPGFATHSNWSPTNPTSTANSRMLMQQGQNAVGANQVVLVDTEKQVMSVYWIAPDTGVIQLKSVRNISADLQLDEFNGSDPTPSKVRSILTQPK